MLINRKFFWLLSFLAVCLLLFAAARIYNSMTDGFFIWDIVYDDPAKSEWEVRPLTSEEHAHVESILNQPFTYFSKGHQAYVFASADGQYVLKFLKRNPVKIKAWFAALPLPEKWENYRNKKIQEKEVRLHAIFTGWKVAFEDLSEESGVLAVSMNRNSGFNNPVTITDRVGNTFQVDLNNTAFLVQRRVHVLSQVLEDYIKTGNIEEAQKLLARLIDLYRSEFDRGLAENDIFLLRNIGVTDEGQPIHLDTGRLHHIAEKPKDYTQELKGKTVLLVKWLESRNSALADYLKQLL
jgi:hypothetical protein